MATKRPKTTSKKTAKRPPDPAVDSQGRPLTVGVRVKFDDAPYVVEDIVVVSLPEGGQQEIVYFRAVVGGGLSQIHLPLVTIQRNGPRKRTKPRSLRDRLRD